MKTRDIFSGFLIATGNIFSNMTDFIISIILYWSMEPKNDIEVEI
jgi:hypothetical protein